MSTKEKCNEKNNYLILSSDFIGYHSKDNFIANDLNFYHQKILIIPRRVECKWMFYVGDIEKKKLYMFCSFMNSKTMQKINVLDFLINATKIEWKLKRIDIGKDQLAYQSSYSSLNYISLILQTNATPKSFKEIISKRYDQKQLIQAINKVVSFDSIQFFFILFLCYIQHF